MTQQIVQATPESVDDWLPLFSAYLDFYQVAQSREHCRDYLRQRLSQRQALVFVAGDADGPNGFVLLYPGYSSLSLQPCWILNDLFVSPKARGRGVAGQLIERAQRHMRELGGGELMLQTAHDNLTAQRLYESLGFALDREFRVYYWNSERS
ncbi:GNAT family N-acetyltransferase [Chromobacterium alticapitis]|uniref:GNAT family N-acetyltransferase n=1 Tax=Chromobacterium alticapitis TaxID=2073169 RepID=A0A2S5DAJ4_9NEIS|nr:GNAT family N-acetyltransferase [Chromobacterium alticapitis]POZ60099.1 GNAT family N-acetyltransferase [Chromobacterium alticapitis]